jgi:hypothetical protein
LTADEAIAALDLPTAARVDRRVPKTLLVEHGAATATDKRRINEGIERLHWVATLKPATIGVAAHRDETREYLEIAVLRLALRPEAKAPRIVELLHRAVPYPVFAVTEQGERVNLSVAHKRWSQGEAEATVLDGDPVAVDAPGGGDPYGDAFGAALALGEQPRSSLHALYQGWLDTLLALAAARLSGGFAILPTADARAARREALGECARLGAEIARLRAAAAKEKQMARQVELNLEVNRIKATLTETLSRL